MLAESASPRLALLVWGAASIAWEALAALIAAPFLVERCLGGCWQPVALYVIPFVVFPLIVGLRETQLAVPTRAAAVMMATGGSASMTLAILLFFDLGGRPTLWLRALTGWGPLLILAFPMSFLCFLAGVALERRKRQRASQQELPTG